MKEQSEPCILEFALAGLLNRYSAEQESDTPDFILAKYMMTCLSAFNESVRTRDEWYGRRNSAIPLVGKPPVRPMKDSEYWR